MLQIKNILGGGGKLPSLNRTIAINAYSEEIQKNDFVELVGASIDRVIPNATKLLTMGYGYGSYESISLDDGRVAFHHANDASGGTSGTLSLLDVDTSGNVSVVSSITGVPVSLNDLGDTCGIGHIGNTVFVMNDSNVAKCSINNNTISLVSNNTIPAPNSSFTSFSASSLAVASDNFLVIAGTGIYNKNDKPLWVGLYDFANNSWKSVVLLTSGSKSQYGLRLSKSSNPLKFFVSGGTVNPVTLRLLTVNSSYTSISLSNTSIKQNIAASPDCDVVFVPSQYGGCNVISLNTNNVVESSGFVCNSGIAGSFGGFSIDVDGLYPRKLIKIDEDIYCSFNCGGSGQYYSYASIVFISNDVAYVLPNSLGIPLLVNSSVDTLNFSCAVFRKSHGIYVVGFSSASGSADLYYTCSRWNGLRARKAVNIINGIAKSTITTSTKGEVELL